MQLASIPAEIQPTAITPVQKAKEQGPESLSREELSKLLKELTETSRKHELEDRQKAESAEKRIRADLEEANRKTAELQEELRRLETPMVAPEHGEIQDLPDNPRTNNRSVAPEQGPAPRITFDGYHPEQIIPTGFPLPSPPRDSAIRNHYVGDRYDARDDRNTRGRNTSNDRGRPHSPPRGYQGRNFNPDFAGKPRHVSYHPEPSWHAVHAPIQCSV